MNTKKIYCLVLMLLFTAVSMKAQENNKLYLSEAVVDGGSTFDLAVNMKNTCQDIAGVQFTLSLPDGVKADVDGIKLTERAKNHNVTANLSNQKLTVMVYSASNQTISANAGTLITIPITLLEWLSQDQELKIEISKVAISDTKGKNVLTDFSSGVVHIKKGVLFILSDVKCETKSIFPEDNLHVEWTVTNSGNLQCDEGWNERIYLVSETGDECLLGEVFGEDQKLGAGAHVYRTTDLKVPRILGVEGKAHLRVELIPYGETGSVDEERKEDTERGSIVVQKKLYLTIPNKVYENISNGVVSCTLERSGSCSSIEPVNMTLLTGDQRISLPNSSFAS